MFAKIFIERPVMAWVISIVILLFGLAALFNLPIAQYPEIAPPTVSVSANYPGASAKVVADTVAAPIEQQVNGVENMLYMSSTCTNDGVYNLTVTFDLGTDLNMAQVLVQNRVSLATPQLPDEVQRQGLNIKKKSPNILLVVNLYSPVDKNHPEYERDQLYMSNYATIQIKDEIARLTGVGDLTIFGQQDYSMRAWLNPNQLKTFGMTASEVVNAIQEQNKQVATGQLGEEPALPGQAFNLTLSTLGRLETVQQFENIVVKTGSDGRQQGTDATQS
ncbi:MAG: efflux RND transporter permease subunit, partial [Bacteroidales bacterium]|nr:efflux RND transporter permease subunit [Bacteroidales bacterium]